MEFVPDPIDGSRNVMKVTITGPGVNLPWSGGELDWWTAYPDWYYWHDTVKLPAAIQATILKESRLGGSYLGVHGSGGVSVAGIEIDNYDQPKLVLRDQNGHDIRVYLNSSLVHRGQWNTYRIEFKPDGKVIPFINGKWAYRYVDEVLTIKEGDNLLDGITDIHTGYQMARRPNSRDYTPPVGAQVYFRDFIVEGP